MYFNKKLTRGWALDRVHNSRRCRLCARWALSQRHLTAPHGCLVATFLTLWPWPLTFWPSINWWARYHDGLSLCQVWRFNFSLFGLLCGQTDRQTESQRWVIVILTRLPSAWVKMCASLGRMSTCLHGAYLFLFLYLIHAVLWKNNK